MTHITPDIQTRVVLLAIIGEQQEQAVEMQKQITKLEEENKELAGRLNTNSQNSSKLLQSTDGYGKATSPKKDSKSADPSPEEDDQSAKPNPKSLRQPSRSYARWTKRS